jgi:hypothetical protein
MFTQYAQFLFKESGVSGITLNDNIATVIYRLMPLLSFT